MSQYTAIYKCRLCGETYTTVCGGESIVEREMHFMAAGRRSEQVMSPTLLDKHWCNDGSFGLSDFQGWRKTE